MRLSRFFLKQSPIKILTDNLVYVMSALLEREAACTKGIGLIANMTGLKMSSFSTSSFRKFLSFLEGRLVPTRVQLVLFVNCPCWFGRAWAMMRPLIGKELRRKAHIISFGELEGFLMEGCDDFLPDDIGGKKRTSAIVQNFIAERQAVERLRPAVYWV